MGKLMSLGKARIFPSPISKKQKNSWIKVSSMLMVPSNPLQQFVCQPEDGHRQVMSLKGIASIS